MEMKWIVLAIAVLMYAIIVIFPNKKSFASLGAALVMIILRVVGPWEAIGSLVNWNVLLIFIGSLVIADLFIYSRVPSVIANTIVEKSPSVGFAVTAILVMTGIISAFVENVATVLVMAPIALALCKKLKLDPTYFMVGLAVMANLQGTATLVGDPPSMIFADYAHYGFNDFFVYQGKLSIFFAVQIGMAAGAVFFYHYFRKEGAQKINIDDKETILTWVPTILLILMIAGLALTSFFHSGISVVSGGIVIGLGLIGVIWYKFIRKEPTEKVILMIKNLDWDTTLFLIGIFIVVGAIAKIGLLDDFSVLLAEIIGGNKLLGFVLIVGVSMIISGFVDNVPYIIAMLPVAAALAYNLSLRPELYMFGLLVGSCLGGNLTPFGASANVVSVGILRKQGVDVSFGKWLKIGLPFTILTTLASSLFVWFVWG